MCGIKVISHIYPKSYPLQLKIASATNNPTTATLTHAAIIATEAGLSWVDASFLGPIKIMQRFNVKTRRRQMYRQARKMLSMPPPCKKRRVYLSGQKHCATSFTTLHQTICSTIIYNLQGEQPL